MVGIENWKRRLAQALADDDPLEALTRLKESANGSDKDTQLLDVLLGLQEVLDRHPRIPIRQVDLHINDPAFAEQAAAMMHELIQKRGRDTA